MKIYIVGSYNNYANWIDDAVIVNNPDEADMLLFAGGEDVDPSFYNEEVGMHTHTNIERDMREYQFFDMYIDKPKLCVCRGSQFATVMSGGKLIQHVTNHGLYKTHAIEDIRTGEVYDMTSTHHQMCYPFDMNPEHYKIIAIATPSRSDTYLNGIDEEIELPENFVECEIIYYKNTNSLAIQGHPEMFLSGYTKEKQYLNKLIKDEFKRL